MSTLDPIDRRLVELLRDNGRASVADLARAVQLSSAPVARRIERLEKSGVIRGYTAIVDDRHSGTIDAFTELRLEGSAETGDMTEVLKHWPEIQAVYTIAGDPDVLVRLRVEDVDHLQRVVNAMRRTGRLTATKTLIVMHSWDRLASHTD